MTGIFSRTVLLLALVASSMVATAAPAAADIDRIGPWADRVIELAASPDGRLVAYLTSDTPGDNKRLWVHRINGGPAVPITPVSHDVHTNLQQVVIHSTGWQFSHDSEYILYRAADDNNVFQLYSVPVTGGAPKLVNRLLEPEFVYPGAAVYNFWTSPNSDYVVWIERRNNEYSAWAARTDGRGRHRLHASTAQFNAPDPSIGGAFPIDFSPDGSAVALAVTKGSGKGAVLQTELGTGTRTAVRASTVHPAFGPLRYTPNGTAVVYTTGRLTYHPIGGSHTNLTTGVIHWYFSRGESYLLYDETPSNQRITNAVALDGSLDTFQVGPKRSYGDYGASTDWNDDYYFYRVGDASYRVAMAPGASPELVHSAMRPGSLSPDGTTWLTSKNGDPYLLSTTPGGSAKRLANLEAGDKWTFRGFSPSGKKLLLGINTEVFMYSASGNRIRLDPKQQHTFILDAGFVSNRRIMFTATNKAGSFGVFVADAFSCGGWLATHVGAKGADTITGTDGRDVIVGLGGDDILRGGDGSDYICGGGGGDTIVGQLGRDHLFGQGGADSIKGSAGNDRLVGGAGTDTLDGGAGTDVCLGGEQLITCE